MHSAKHTAKGPSYEEQNRKKKQQQQKKLITENFDNTMTSLNSIGKFVAWVNHLNS